MSLTFFAKSSAYSWKMSFCGHALCQRMVIGPCALATIGKESALAPAAATAAPVRNFLREGSGVVCETFMSPPLRRRMGTADREWIRPPRAVAIVAQFPGLTAIAARGV